MIRFGNTNRTTNRPTLSFNEECEERDDCTDLVSLVDDEVRDRELLRGCMLTNFTRLKKLRGLASKSCSASMRSNVLVDLGQGRVADVLFRKRQPRTRFAVEEGAASSALPEAKKAMQATMQLASQLNIHINGKYRRITNLCQSLE